LIGVALFIYGKSSNKRSILYTESIVLLFRDLSFTHGEYKDTALKYLSIPIKPAGIPNRACDKHTSADFHPNRNQLGYIPLCKNRSCVNPAVFFH